MKMTDCVKFVLSLFRCLSHSLVCSKSYIRLGGNFIDLTRGFTYDMIDVFKELIQTNKISGVRHTQQTLDIHWHNYNDTCNTAVCFDFSFFPTFFFFFFSFHFLIIFIFVFLFHLFILLWPLLIVFMFSSAVFSSCRVFTFSIFCIFFSFLAIFLPRVYFVRFIWFISCLLLVECVYWHFDDQICFQLHFACLDIFIFFIFYFISF